MYVLSTYTSTLITDVFHKNCTCELDKDGQMGLGFPLYMAVVLSAIPAELELPALVAYFTDWLLMFEVVIAVEASCFVAILFSAESIFMFSSDKSAFK